MIRRRHKKIDIAALVFASCIGAGAAMPAMAEPTASASCGQVLTPRTGTRLKVRPICASGNPATASPSGLQSTDETLEPAAVTFSRAVDLDSDSPVFFARSGNAGVGASFALSTRGRPFDPVQLLNPPDPPPSLGIVATGRFRPIGAPLQRATLTSGFGIRMHPLLGYARAHAGLDLAAPYGSPIYATSDGVVGAANWRGGYGLTVALEHGGGVETRYAHMSRIAVVPGQPVRAGQVIGYVGSTGLSTGPHLHYEVREQGRAVNPAATLRR